MPMSWWRDLRFVTCDVCGELAVVQYETRHPAGRLRTVHVTSGYKSSPDQTGHGVIVRKRTRLVASVHEEATGGAR